MAIKATIYKAQLQLANMDRNIYCDPALTIARHPSEADERMMIRVLALAMGWPSDTSEGTIELAKDMWEPDEPALPPVPFPNRSPPSAPLLHAASTSGNTTTIRRTRRETMGSSSCQQSSAFRWSRLGSRGSARFSHHPHRHAPRAPRADFPPGGEGFARGRSASSKRQRALRMAGRFFSAHSARAMMGSRRLRPSRVSA